MDIVALLIFITTIFALIGFNLFRAVPNNTVNICIASYHSTNYAISTSRR